MDLYAVVCGRAKKLRQFEETILTFVLLQKAEAGCVWALGWCRKYSLEIKKRRLFASSSPPSPQLIVLANKNEKGNPEH